MAWYLKLPNGAFLNKRGIGTQQQADAFGSQAAAQAAIPYYAHRMGGEKATAVNLGAPSAQTLDSPGYDPKLSDVAAVNTVPSLDGVIATDYAAGITGYGAT